MWEHEIMTTNNKDQAKALCEILEDRFYPIRFKKSLTPSTLWLISGTYSPNDDDRINWDEIKTYADGIMAGWKYLTEKK